MRLIDADALLENITPKLSGLYIWERKEVLKAITNAPTVQREHKYCGRKIDLAYGSTNCGSDFHGSIKKCDDCATETTVQREGWVSVPIEPTEEMLELFFNEMSVIGYSASKIDLTIDELKQCYKAMLSAATKE